MAVTRFWAPPLVLLLACQLKLKWSKLVQNYDLDICEALQTTCIQTILKNTTELLRNESGYREFSRAKKSCVIFRLDRLNDPSQLPMLLLLLGGDIEVNPGHNRKFPCGICLKPVKKNQAGIQCGECSNWFHVNTKCIDISPTVYSTLVNSSCMWNCPTCGLPNFSDSFFDSSIHSLNSPNVFEPLNQTTLVESLSPGRVPVHNRNKEKLPRRSNLTCLVVNCRSVRNKIADLAVVINEHKPAFVLGNESWLKSNINSREIFPENYRVYRKDRDNNSRGGGVFQAVKSDLIMTHRSEWGSDCEIIWTQCQLAGIRTAKSIYFGSYYRPNISDTESLEEVNTSFLKMGAALHQNNVILTGDFNAPDVNWDNPLDQDDLTTASKRLLEVLDDNDLIQFVKEPTRRQETTQNILDLVLSNNKDIIGRVKVIDGISDHDIVLFTVKTSCLRKRIVKRKV